MKLVIRDNSIPEDATSRLNPLAYLVELATFVTNLNLKPDAT